MKKSSQLLLPILACMFLFSSTAKAQLSVGLRGGANFANLAVAGDYSQDYPLKAKAGLNFAVLFNVPVGTSTSIQFEPGFSQRGARISETLSETVNGQQIRAEITGKYLINYIEMPILFQYKPKLGKLEGIFSLGPELRLLANNMKTKESVKAYINGELSVDNSEENTYTLNDDARKFDYGIVGGAGLAYPFAAFKIFAEGRYHFGLRNLATPYGGDDNTKVHNRGASAHIGILVPVGK